MCDKCRNCNSVLELDDRERCVVCGAEPKPAIDFAAETKSLIAKMSSTYVEAKKLEIATKETPKEKPDYIKELEKYDSEAEPRPNAIIVYGQEVEDPKPSRNCTASGLYFGIGWLAQTRRSGGIINGI